MPCGFHWRKASTTEDSGGPFWKTQFRLSMAKARMPRIMSRQKPTSWPISKAMRRLSLFTAISPQGAANLRGA